MDKSKAELLKLIERKYIIPKVLAKGIGAKFIKNDNTKSKG